MNYRLHSIVAVLLTIIIFTSCSDDETVTNPPIPEQPEQLAELTAQYNTNISAYQAMMDEKAEIIDYTSDGNGNYKLQLSNQLIADVYAKPLMIKIYLFSALIKKDTGTISWKVPSIF